MRGDEGHSGQSKGDHSAKNPGSSLCSSPTQGSECCLPQQHLPPARLYLRCLKPWEPSGPRGCLITLLGCLVSSGWEILGGLQGERRSEEEVGSGDT